MVLINLCAGRQWRCRHGERVDTGGGRGWGDGKDCLETYTLPHVNRSRGICPMTPGTLTVDLPHDSGNSNRGFAA